MSRKPPRSVGEPSRATGPSRPSSRRLESHSASASGHSRNAAAAQAPTPASQPAAVSAPGLPPGSTCQVPTVRQPLPSATGWQRLRWVVWPTIRAPLASGALIVAAFVLGAFEVPLAVGPSYPPTLATYAADQPQLDLVTGQARAAAALLVAAAASLTLAIAAVRLARGAGRA
jgi:hypothetical protein